MYNVYCTLDQKAGKLFAPPPKKRNARLVAGNYKRAYQIVSRQVLFRLPYRFAVLWLGDDRQGIHSR